MQEEQDEMIEESVSLLDYLLPLVRWRWLIFGCCALFGLLGVLKVLPMSPFYTATVYFIPSGAMGDKDELDSLGGTRGKDWSQVRVAGELVKYYDIAMKTQPLMEVLLDRSFHTVEHGNVTLENLLMKDAREPSREKAVFDLREKLKIASGGGKVLTVEYDAGEPQLAADVVNVLLEEFGRQPRDVGRASDDVKFIQDRIEDVRARLELKEIAISEGKSRSLDLGQPDAVRELAALEREARLLERSYENLNAELAKAEIRMIQSQKDTGRQIEILSPAEPPVRPAGPNRTKIVVVFLFVGFVLSTGAAFVIEYFANMQRQFREHPFWALLRKSRRDLIIMASVTGLLLVAAILYRALR